MNNQNNTDHQFTYPYAVYPYYYPQSQPVYYPSFYSRQQFQPAQTPQENEAELPMRPTADHDTENLSRQLAEERSIEEVTDSEELQLREETEIVPNENQFTELRELPSQTLVQPGINVPGMLPIQQSYIENILRLNRGKRITVYMTFPDKVQKTFVGNIEAAGRDHIILSDPETGERYLLLMIYLDYVVFEEEINYKPPAFPGSQLLTTSPPR